MRGSYCVNFARRAFLFSQRSQMQMLCALPDTVHITQYINRQIFKHHENKLGTYGLTQNFFTRAPPKFINVLRPQKDVH